MQAYLDASNNPDLSVAEVIWFGGEFYARVREQSTGRFAFSVLVVPSTGDVRPEPGPIVSWNSLYGQGTGADTAMAPGRARQFAQASLDANVPGTTAGDPLAFYGYYTFEVRQADQVIGMVNVNDVTGEVWYHNQYGPYLDRLIVTP